MPTLTEVGLRIFNAVPPTGIREDILISFLGNRTHDAVSHADCQNCIGEMIETRRLGRDGEYLCRIKPKETPWCLTTQDGEAAPEVRYYRTKTQTLQWALQALRKHQLCSIEHWRQQDDAWLPYALPHQSTQDLEEMSFESASFVD